MVVTTAEFQAQSFQMSQAVRSIFESSRQIALDFGCGFVMPEHVLIALMRWVKGNVSRNHPDESKIMDLCLKFRTNPDHIIREIEKRVKTYPHTDQILSTPTELALLTKDVLTTARTFARGEVVGVKELFVGLLRIRENGLGMDSVAALVLTSCGFVWNEVLVELGFDCREVTVTVHAVPFKDLGAGEPFIIVQPSTSLTSLLALHEGNAVVLCALQESEMVSGQNAPNAVGYFNPDIKLHILPDQAVQRCV